MMPRPKKRDNTMYLWPLSHLMEEFRAANCQEKKWVINATIVKLRTSLSWKYTTYAVCKRSVHRSWSQYFCNSCHKMEENPLIRYCVNLNIMGATITTTVTAINKKVERLIGLDMDKMIRISKMALDEINSDVADCCPAIPHARKEKDEESSLLMMKTSQLRLNQHVPRQLKNEGKRKS